MQNEQGFTLLEMTLVLAVFTVCLGAALIPLRAVSNEIEDRQFFNQLERDLFEAQTFAIVNNASVAVKFFEEKQNKYRIFTLENPQKNLKERKIPARFTHGKDSLMSLAFLTSGTTSKSGTVDFITAQKTTKLVFLLGRGRFYFFEE